MGLEAMLNPPNEPGLLHITPVAFRPPPFIFHIVPPNHILTIVSRHFSGFSAFISAIDYRFIAYWLFRSYDPYYWLSLAFFIFAIR